MKIIRKNFILIFIVMIAVFLRFYQLGVNPPSIDWDEASLGYNAYSILKTGADEYGNKFPSAIRSFDDYKPASYVYLAIPSIKFFGLTEFATRLPSALFGVFTVIITFFLVKELFQSKKVALLSSALLAISPWHLQFSRAAFEANVGLFFFVTGIFIFLKALKDKRFFILSFLFFVISLYSYHSLRLVAPFFFLGVFVYFKDQLWKERKTIFIATIFSLVLLIPYIQNTFTNLSRFSSVTVITPTGTLDYSIKQLQYDKERGDLLGQIFHNRRLVYGMTVLKGYLDHYDLNFLFVKGDGVERHHPVNFGMLYPIELPLVFLGIFALFTKKIPARFIIFWWFLVAPLASSLTTGTPHPVRALTFLPTFQIFAALGILWILDARFKNLIIKKAAVSLLILVFIFDFIYYFHQYHVHTPLETSKNWQYGYKELFQEVAKVEDKYEKILITYKYDQPYIFYLFYRKIDPSNYQKMWDYKGDGTTERERRVIGKYEFRNINFSEDKKQPRTLIIGTPSEIPSEDAIKEIKFLDGSVAFRIAES